MWLALLLNRHFRGKRIVRASMLLPFIVPTVLSTFAWRWMFDPTFSVLNWLLFQPASSPTKLPFLSDGTSACGARIVVNTWRGMPFFAITLLAGLQTISPDLHEAASLDGANGWQRFWHVTWPLLKPVTLVVVVFSVIQTFSDFQLIYVLTGGGPANATHLARDLRLPDRRRHRAARRGRRDLAVHVAGALHRGLAPARYLAPPGRRLSHGHRARAGRQWVYFYIPLTVFIIGTLFPFYWMLVTAIRPDAELYRSWRAANNDAVLDARSRRSSTSGT